MSKKIFTLLLLAVFMLAQFSVASAIAVDGDAAITAIPDFSSGTDVDVDWAVSGMAAGTKNILMWAREVPAAVYAVTECKLVATIVGTSDASGTFPYDFTTTALALGNGDQVEFAITVDDNVCATAALPAIDSVMGVSYVDNFSMNGIMGSPPSLLVANRGLRILECNTTEYWTLLSDEFALVPGTVYSGFGAWNLSTTGTFAPPAPIGPDNEFLSWVITLPATATGPWTYSMEPEDAAGNLTVLDYWRDHLAIDPSELAACADFTDVAGHEDEAQIRYLADLGLISGFADGSFGPDATLTRAEAATLFEISNGVSDTDPGFGTPPAAGSACDFSDVSAADWFAGWVWQACADGYMNGVGGGLFDPNNLLTRGQIVTIMGNVVDAGGTGGYLVSGTVINVYWNHPLYSSVRNAAFTDVSVGAFYADSVIRAYGMGVADGTSETTFSPDQPVTRGEFARMLYRALSRFF